ncbi:hypothetical protein SDC9_183570 [bioreactor metagenome]|uniref:Uncharacterized protein n=1 Tax=bioreactor metagenome TaxID=1076179 RepID=A0A645HAK5_9ZZZZ
MARLCVLEKTCVLQIDFALYDDDVRVILQVHQFVIFPCRRLHDEFLFGVSDIQAQFILQVSINGIFGSFGRDLIDDVMEEVILVHDDDFPGNLAQADE